MRGKSKESKFMEFNIFTNHYIKILLLTYSYYFRFHIFQADG